MGFITAVVVHDCNICPVIELLSCEYVYA